MTRAHITEVRPVTDDDKARARANWGAAWDCPPWVAVDSKGRRFFGDSEAEARTMADNYNAGRRCIVAPATSKTDDNTSPTSLF